MNESRPRFSICIPNFNYERYLSETLSSVFAQRLQDFEVVVSDNASTDGSVALIESYATDFRLGYKVNPSNIGFAANLRECAGMACGEYLLMLSSDDLMSPEALELYDRIYRALSGDLTFGSVLCSTVTVIDGKGAQTGCAGIDWKLWAGAQRDNFLSREIAADVYGLDAKALLGNALRLLRTPFNFASTMYPKALHDAVGGYAKLAHINPDKRFAWELLGRAGQAYIIDKPLFSYRVHDNNQNSRQARSGALKHLVDQYSATFDVSDELLGRARLTRDDFCHCFVEQDIALRGLAQLAAGDRRAVRRTLHFAMAAYPALAARNRKVSLLRAGLRAGALGSAVARFGFERAKRRWENKLARRTGDTVRKRTSSTVSQLGS